MLPNNNSLQPLRNKQMLSRRTFLRSMAFGAGVVALTACVPVAPSQGTADEGGDSSTASAEQIVMHVWHDSTASDGEVLNQWLENFNTAHPDGNVRLTYETVPEIGTKVMTSIAAGTTPDISFRPMSDIARWQAADALVPLDDMLNNVGLDFEDFYQQYVDWARIDGELYTVPMDVAPMAALINAQHAEEAGLDINNPPADNATLLEWAKAMTVVENGQVTRSGFLNTGSGFQPNTVFGIIAMQMGAQMLNPERTQVTFLDTDAPAAAAQWVLDTFDTHQISSRDVADRYAAFGQQVGSIFWTGQWTLFGYANTEGLDFIVAPVSNVGGKMTTETREYGMCIFNGDGDATRHQAGAEALKWLSDNSLLWVTEGRGPSPRRSILENPDFQTGGLPWELRKPFAEAVEYAFFDYLNFVGGNEFAFYSSGTSTVARSMDPVWAGEQTIEQGLEALAAGWQKVIDDLNKG
jgi:multiple sugar transport system substrate-binding protein